ncbi:MAG: nicotinamide riboside transporter PnuC [Paracoccus sp. (in: a-proteobacteria)]|nr:nicotinamide riboside transporter PnuC [Paracoccus sp. (in: a-proteobacteria)]
MLDFVISMFGTRSVEWIAAACGLVNVVLIVRRSVWNYPFGFAMVVLYFFIFRDYRLYSDAALQVYYFLIQIYGVWYWLQGQADDGRIIVVPLARSRLAGYLALTGIIWLVIAALMARHTDAAAPWQDAAVAALSVLAQFLLARRHLESWLIWIAVDLLAIDLFISRGLMPTAALYVIFLGLAITGWFQWRRARRQGGAP